jgi:hypothetical protein
MSPQRSAPALALIRIALDELRAALEALRAVLRS